jgi:hypothetical protein
MQVIRILVLFALALSFGCGGPPSSQGDDPSEPNNSVELTDEIIHERINEAWLSQVPEENGAAEPISWRFINTEPKEITVVEKTVEGTKATIVLDIKTSSSPRSRDQRYLYGQIRTEWELRTGWALRKWEIADVENISMKYRNLPKLPPPANANR